jgi:sec-independent protein translocase protein TatA
MPFRLGPLELTLILVIVVLLFGVGRVSKIAGEIGSGIKAFRQNLKDPEGEKPSETPKDESPKS